MPAPASLPLPTASTPAAAELPPNLLRAGRFGLEREALRVTRAGRLALTPHPVEFGDKLHHGPVTVDFSESQLEMITSPQPSVEAALGELASIHDQVEAVLDVRDERLWPFSMPPALPPDAEIPIARFGASPAGRELERYRIGLGHRYGRRRQMISGLHFSFSFSPALLDLLPAPPGVSDVVAARDAAYFRTARNFLRNRWFLIYLTGASPAADASFGEVVHSHLDRLRACCPGCCAEIDGVDRDAVSLRMSRHGYADTAFGSVPVSFDDRSSYVADLRRLLSTRSDRFARLGLTQSGAPVQLNDRVLQRESEFYAAIRLKGRIAPGGSHLDAIDREGVHYAEVRLLDIDPFVREGIDIETLRFLQVLLLDALFGPSAPLSLEEWERAQENHHRIALAGRRPGLQLRTSTGEIPVTAAAEPILSRLGALARRMEEGLSDRPFSHAVDRMRQRLRDPSELPSARIHDALRRRGLTHAAYGRHLLAPATVTQLAVA